MMDTRKRDEAELHNLLRDKALTQNAAHYQYYSLISDSIVLRGKAAIF